MNNTITGKERSPAICISLRKQSCKLGLREKYETGLFASAVSYLAFGELSDQVNGPNAMVET
jgi:hypothetical protein